MWKQLWYQKINTIENNSKIVENQRSQTQTGSKHHTVEKISSSSKHVQTGNAGEGEGLIDHAELCAAVVVGREWGRRQCVVEAAVDVLAEELLPRRRRLVVDLGYPLAQLLVLTALSSFPARQLRHYCIQVQAV